MPHTSARAPRQPTGWRRFRNLSRDLFCASDAEYFTCWVLARVDIACGVFTDLVVEPKVDPGLRKADAEDIVRREHRTYVLLTLF